MVGSSSTFEGPLGARKVPSPLVRSTGRYNISRSPSAPSLKTDSVAIASTARHQPLPADSEFKSQEPELTTPPTKAPTDLDNPTPLRSQSDTIRPLTLSHTESEDPTQPLPSSHNWKCTTCRTTTLHSQKSATGSTVLICKTCFKTYNNAAIATLQAKAKAQERSVKKLTRFNALSNRLDDAEDRITALDNALATATSENAKLRETLNEALKSLADKDAAVRTTVLAPPAAQEDFPIKIADTPGDIPNPLKDPEPKKQTFAEITRKPQSQANVATARQSLIEAGIVSEAHAPAPLQPLTPVYFVATGQEPPTLGFLRPQIRTVTEHVKSILPCGARVLEILTPVNHAQHTRATMSALGLREWRQFDPRKDNSARSQISLEQRLRQAQVLYIAFICSQY